MALKAGYYGVKKNILDELDKLDGILPAGVSKTNKLATAQDIETLTTSKADAAALGPVESGSTASQAYEVGEHFYKDGHFCTVTQSIASEGALTKGTNYVEGTIADNIETLTTSKADAAALGPVESGSTASQQYAVGEHFYKDGAFCTVTQSIASGGTLTQGTNYSVGTVADNLIKQSTFSGTTNANGYLEVNANGVDIVSVRMSGRIGIPFILSSTSYVKVLDRDSLDSVPNTSVSGTYFYI